MSCDEYGIVNRDCGACAGCQGAYPDIASAFDRVPDNYNGVTNFFPKRPVYNSMQVVRKAVMNVQQAGPDAEGLNNAISSPYENCNSCETESMGFVGFPLILETNVVDVCGKAKCIADGPDVPNQSCTEGGCSCQNNNAFCDGLGYTWAQTGGRIGYFRAVEACGKIRQDVGCNKDFNPNCNYGPYETLLSCGGDASVRSLASARSLNSKKARKVRAARAIPRARGGCGCK